MLVSALQTRLSAKAATSFAGTARASDGGIDVYVTAADASVDAIVQELSGAVGGVNVHIVDGMKNSLATLESVRDEILARRQALLARDIRVVEFGVHVTANRVRVGVKGLTEGAAAHLTANSVRTGFWCLKAANTRPRRAEGVDVPASLFAGCGTRPDPAPRTGGWASAEPQRRTPWVTYDLVGSRAASRASQCLVFKARESNGRCRVLANRKQSRTPMSWRPSPALDYSSRDFSSLGGQRQRKTGQ